ncbi:hypothetical protein [Ornithinibacillus xuwenensis]|uniref:TetR family transcriptional regulator n=1 Tax=Ornithinibacillus xuwenensis TaxID=3144668 RepID=A0ABU9XF61_9BACI
MLDSFENEMIEKIEEVIVNNLPKERSDQLFIQSSYDTTVQILTCYEENKELLQFLLKSSYSSFQTKLRNKLKLVFTNLIFPILGELEYEIPTDLFTIAFTSISLSLAEYAYQSETPINIEKSANLLFNIVLEGPAKTLGLIKDGDI